MYRFNQYALFVSSGNYLSNQIISGGLLQIPRVQSSNFTLNFQREDLAYLNEASELVRMDNPVVDLTFEYLNTNGLAERSIGLITDGENSAFWNLNQEKNYYILVEDDFVDANLPNSSTARTIGIGNGILNGYSISASVGEIIKTTCSVQALNVSIFTGFSGITPAIDYRTANSIGNGVVVRNPSNQISAFSVNSADDVIAVGTKDLIMEFPSGSVFATVISGANACQLQNFTLAFSVGREIGKPLGFAYPTERRVNFPITVEVTAEAYLEQYQIASLNGISCADSGHDINILIKQPCSNLLALEFYLKGLKLESQQINTSVGSNFTTVSFNWKGLVGNLNNTGNNLLIKANQGSEYYTLESVTPISGFDANGDLFFSEQSFYRRRMSENDFYSGTYL